MQTPDGRCKNWFTRRAFLAGLAWIATSRSRASAQSTQPEMVGQGLRFHTTDFATDRAAFHTRLVVKGPSPQPGEMPSAPRDVRMIDYLSDNLRLKAWIGVPKNAPPRIPVVIFLHGGFAFAAEDFDMGRPYLAAGYALVMPLLRGEDGQPGHFTMFYDEVTDVIAIMEYVRRQPFADPAHIYLAGHSAGGTLAMLAGMASSGFRAVASFSGSPDRIAFTNAEPWSRIVPFDRGNPLEFELRSPLAYASSLKSPTRLFYSSGEGGSTRAMASLAQRASLDVEAVEVPGDHFSAVPEEIQRSIAFFRAHE